MQNSKPLIISIIENIEVPDWLIDAAFCETNKEFIETPEILKFIDEQLLPQVDDELDYPENLHVSSSHVHIGSHGLTPHDHLPHEYTSVLYLVDGDGDIVLHLDELQRVSPVAGRLLLMDASIVHSVEAGHGLRLSLVVNYATRPL